MDVSRYQEEARTQALNFTSLARPYFSFNWGHGRTKNNSLVKLACQVRVALSKNFLTGNEKGGWAKQPQALNICDLL